MRIDLPNNIIVLKGNPLKRVTYRGILDIRLLRKWELVKCVYTIHFIIHYNKNAFTI